MAPPPPRTRPQHQRTASAILGKQRLDSTKDAAAQAEWSSKKWVWVPHPTEGYVPGWVLKEEGDHAIIKLESGDPTPPIPLEELPYLRVNPPAYSKADDIADLTYLNEASVVHNLKTRYSEDSIYTYSGLFLVAVNPYKSLPIYTTKVVERFKNKRRDENAPHVYAVAEKAWQSMMAHRDSSQSILVTGESGAGKTENTKKVIQYLAAIAADPLPTSSSFDLLARQATIKGTSGGGQIGGKKLGQLERQILEANPILEAFGNAQTVKNNNSSRFGKFVRIFFNPIGAIAGANIDWYLLEKSRVTSRSTQERAFHIFFQLLLGADASLKEELLLTGNPKDYEYLKHSSQEVENMDDREEFQLFLNALQTVGFSSEEQLDLFRVIAAILHLGNITVGGTETAHIPSMPQLERVCHLLGLAEPKDLLNALVRPKVKAGREWVVQARTNKQVVDELGALSKALYEKNFGKMVDRINKALGRPSTKTFIGVLDIAGFEIFQTNGFEQLCINLTNEKLQQFFNHHMFVIEQNEYGAEQIDWEFRNFGLELQPTIDLIESNNPMGVLSCLDDACIMPKATDESFTNRMHDLAKAKPIATQFTKYSASRIERGFTISHYAGNVEYRTDGWLDKNRDPLSDTLTSLLAESKSPYIASMFAEYAEAVEEPAFDGPRKRVRKGAFRTVGQRHKDQLAFLMSQLHETQPHFVRCIVPNTRKLPGLIDTPLVLEQLRCNGVIEGIRIARLGYPNRLPFAEFRRRFQVLVPGSAPTGFVDGKEACQRILSTIELDRGTYQLGITKVFFKAGILAKLEEARDDVLSDIFTRVQAACRMFAARRQANKKLHSTAAARMIQRNARIYIQLKAWPWWPLFQRVRPLLAAARSNEEVRRREEELVAANERAQKEEKERERLEALQMELQATQVEMERQLASERARGSEREERLKSSKQREEELEELLKQAEGDVTLVDEHLARALEAKKYLEGRIADLDASVVHSNALVQTLQNEQAGWKAKEAEWASQTSVKTAEWQAINLDRDTKASTISKLNLDLVDARRERERLSQSLKDVETKAAQASRDSTEARKTIATLQGESRSAKEEIDKLDRERRELKSRAMATEAELTTLRKDAQRFSAERDTAAAQIRDLEVKLSSLTIQIGTQARQLKDSSAAADKSAADLASLTKLLEAKSSDHDRQSQLNQIKETEIQTLKVQVSKTASELATAQRNAADEATRLRQDFDKARRESAEQMSKNQELSRRAARSEARVAELEAAKEELQRAHQAHELQLELVRNKALEDTMRGEAKWEKEKKDFALQFQRFEDETLAAQRAAETSRKERDALQTLLDHEQATVRARDANLASLKEKMDQQYSVLADADLANSNLRSEMRDLKSQLRILEDRAGKTVVEHIRVLEETMRLQNLEMDRIQSEKASRDAYTKTQEKAKASLAQQVEDLQAQRDAERRQKVLNKPPFDDTPAKLAKELERECRLRQEDVLHIGRLNSENQRLQLDLQSLRSEINEMKRSNSRLELDLNHVAASDHTQPVSLPRDRRMQESRAANVSSPTRHTFLTPKPTVPSSSNPPTPARAPTYGRRPGYE